MYITIVHRRCQVGKHGFKKNKMETGPRLSRIFSHARIAERIVCALWMASKEFLLLCHSCIQNIMVQLLVHNPCFVICLAMWIHNRLRSTKYFGLLPVRVVVDSVPPLLKQLRPRFQLRYLGSYEQFCKNHFVSNV